MTDRMRALPTRPLRKNQKSKRHEDRQLRFALTAESKSTRPRPTTTTCRRASTRTPLSTATRTHMLPHSSSVPRNLSGARERTRTTFRHLFMRIKPQRLGTRACIYHVQPHPHGRPPMHHLLSRRALSPPHPPPVPSTVFPFIPLVSLITGSTEVVVFVKVFSSFDVLICVQRWSDIKHTSIQEPEWYAYVQ